MTSSAAGVLLAAAAAAPAHADQRGPVVVPGVDGPGPASTDRVRLIESGPKTAKRVLVLMPGTSAGAGNTALVGEEIAKRLKGWQVWSISRRETLLEDHATMDGLLDRTVDPQRAFDHYLGWVGNETITERLQLPTPAQEADARQWGMQVAIEDLHRVVQKARRSGRQVVLGGHSLGASIAAAYATWDFDGRPGAKDLSGLLLVDGGSSRSDSALTSAKDARDALAAAEATSPFLDLSGFGLPWAVGVLGELSASLARIEPTAPARVAAWPLLPPALRPPIEGAVTSRAGFAFGVDSETSPENLALAHMHLGRLADSGDPRDWVDGELATVDHGAQVFTNPILGGTSWFHPTRLSLDAGAVQGGVRNAAQRVLGLRTWHGDDLDIPLYAYETSLGDGRVVKGAKALAKRSRLPKRMTTYVDRSATTSHLDPLAAAPATNDFLKTVLPFLRAAVRR